MDFERPKNEDIGFLLKTLNNKLDTYRTKNMTPLELTSSQFEVLLLLVKNQDRVFYQTDLEKILNRSNPTITGILKRLEGKGFIQKISRPNDKRFKQIVPTQKAIDYIEEGDVNRRRGEELLTEGLSGEECETMRRCLKIMVDNLKKYKEDFHD